MKKKKYFSFTLALFVFPCFGETNQITVQQSPWQGEFNIGYRAIAGNTEAQTFHTQLSGEYATPLYRHRGDIRYFWKEEDNEEIQKRRLFDWQSAIKIHPRHYLFMNTHIVEDRYGSYFTDLSFALGWGYQMVQDNAHYWEIELGPAYRHQRPNLDEIDEDDRVQKTTINEIILRVGTLWTWDILDTITLESRITALTGQSNTTLEAELSMNYDISEHIGLKLGYEHRYHQWVPSTLRPWDSFTTLNVRFYL